MKYLKSQECYEATNLNKIYNFIWKKYHIENYTINGDGSVDVDGHVDLISRELRNLPIKFRNVTGCFWCHLNELTSLEGSPIKVDDDFYCSNNQLKSLKGSPESVGGNFLCNNNQLTSLEGVSKHIGGLFYCDNNRITTFEHLPLSIGDIFSCSGNPIFEIWRLFADYDKIEFLNDCDPIREPNKDSKEPIVILDRLNYFLEEIGKKTVTEVKGYKCI
jgi:hypothetical protein